MAQHLDRGHRDLADERTHADSRAATIFTSLNWTVTHVGDFNGDGKDDLVWRSGTGQTAVWLMNGLASSSSATIFTSVPWAVTHVGDFDGDGKDDLAWRNNSTGQTAVWLMNGHGDGLQRGRAHRRQLGGHAHRRHQRRRQVGPPVAQYLDRRDRGVADERAHV